MDKTDRLIKNYGPCYVCGDQNFKGLQLRFRCQGKYVLTTVEPQIEYMGHGRVHGGIIGSILDETMGLAVTIEKKRLCITAEITIRYLKPLDIGCSYEVRGNMTNDRRLIQETYGEILNTDRQICVRAIGKYILLSEQDSEKIHPSEFR